MGVIVLYVPIIRNITVVELFIDTDLKELQSGKYQVRVFSWEINYLLVGQSWN